jgi:cytochrome P450
MPGVRIPPRPRGLPLLGHLIAYARDPLGFLTRCAREYGDVVRLCSPTRTFYLLSHPEHIEHVLRHNHSNYIKWQPLRATSRTFGSGLLTAEGEHWKKQRRLCNPAFQMKQVRTYVPTFVEFTDRMLAGWHAGQTRIVTDDFVDLTLAIVARVLFGVDLGGEAGNVLGGVLDYFGSPLHSLLLPSWLPTPATLRYKKAVRALDTMIGRLTKEGRARNPEERAAASDLLSRLLSARDEDGTGMDEKQLRDELITIGFAGHKTTAAALTYSFYLLAQHPAADERMAAEAREVLGDRPATADDLPRLPFTTWVLNEALRLYPPSWGIGREALADDEVGGFHIPKGTQVVLPQWVVQRDPRWFDDPEVFRPERWDNDLESRLPRCAYFPFGDGPRVCIGANFAVLESVLILATIARRFRLTLVPGQTFRLVPSITLWPKPGISLVVHDRRR